MALNLRDAMDKHLEGFAMKTVIVVLGLSILSAIVGIFAATELHEMSIEADATQPSQKIQQWVNQ